MTTFDRTVGATLGSFVPGPTAPYAPDFVGAWIAYLRDCPEVTALTDQGGKFSRIGTELKLEWEVPKRQAIRIRPIGGSSSADLPVWMPRMDVFCYGSYLHNATDLAIKVLGWLVPDKATGRVSRWNRKGTTVWGVQVEMLPQQMLETNTNYPMCWVTFRYNMLTVPTP